MLTEQYDINRWFRNFGARPKELFQHPLNDLLFSHAGLQYRQTYHNGAGITFHSMLLSSPLLVSASTVLLHKSQSYKCPTILCTMMLQLASQPLTCLSPPSRTGAPRL